MLSSRQNIRTTMLTALLTTIGTTFSLEDKESTPFDKINLGTIGYNGSVNKGEKYKKSMSVRSTYILNNKHQETKANKKYKRKLSTASRKANRKK